MIGNKRLIIIVAKEMGRGKVILLVARKAY